MLELLEGGGIWLLLCNLLVYFLLDGLSLAAHFDYEAELLINSGTTMKVSSLKHS